MAHVLDDDDDDYDDGLCGMVRRKLAPGLMHPETLLKRARSNTLLRVSGYTRGLC